MRSPYLTTAEAAEYLRTTPNAIRIAVSRGHLKPDGKGRQLLFLVETRERYVASRIGTGYVHEHHGTAGVSMGIVHEQESSDESLLRRSSHLGNVISIEGTRSRSENRETPGLGSHRRGR